MDGRARALDAVARTAREFAEQAQRLHHRELANHRAAHGAEALLPRDDTAVPGGGGKVHEADRLCGAAAAGAGDAGDGDGEIGVGVAERAARHRFGGFAAYCAVVFERRFGNAEHRALGRIRIGDEAAVDDVGGAGDLGERAGDEAAGAGLRGRDLEFAGAAKLEQAGRGLPQLVVDHFCRHGALTAAVMGVQSAGGSSPSPSRRCLRGAR